MSSMPQGNCLFIMSAVTICAAAHLAHHTLFITESAIQRILLFCIDFT